MTPVSRAALCVAVCLAVLAAAPAVFGDEGMWLFNKPPIDYLKKHYNFTPTKAWLEHVQKSSVRFNTGGSGSFVSADGLVMTNHHVGAATLQKVSTAEHNYLRDGFHARTNSEEIKSIDLEINVLMDIQDVTKRVNDAVKADMKPAEAFAARRGVMAEIEEESKKKTGYRSDVVTLYQGGVYNLYRYKVYTDVRLVFAPEAQAAFYGGDPDNFEYPRFDMDVCFFRVYEDGKPIHPEHYLKWSKSGAADDELVFVSGHPGRTERLDTVANLEALRDVETPYVMQRLFRAEVMLETFSRRSEENAREAKEDLFGVQNSRKAYIGRLAGLQDPSLMERKQADETKLREAVARDAKLKYAVDSWDRIAKAEKVRTELLHRYTMLEGGSGFKSQLFAIARTLVRAGEELPKKSEDRLREFRQSALDELKFHLFSEEPIYPNYEIAKLTDGLTFLTEQLGYDDPLVQQGAGRQVAAEPGRGTRQRLQAHQRGGPEKAL